MSRPVSNPTKKLVVKDSSSDVNSAIVFIPALSLKYKLINADPALQQYTFSGDELARAGVYIDIRCAPGTENNTEVTLAVRRRKGAAKRNSDVSVANQHLDTLGHLLSDSLRLEPENKARLLSTKRNEQTAGEHRSSQASAEILFPAEKQAFFREKNVRVLLVSLFIVAAAAYVVYRYLVR